MISWRNALSLSSTARLASATQKLRRRDRIMRGARRYRRAKLMASTQTSSWRELAAPRMRPARSAQAGKSQNSARNKHGATTRGGIICPWKSFRESAISSSSWPGRGRGLRRRGLWQHNARRKWRKRGVASCGLDRWPRGWPAAALSAKRRLLSARIREGRDQQ